MKLRHFWIFGMVCVLLSATAFSAQSTTATIQGLVSDEQKALVPGVTITARNLETNATRSAVSNDEGRYRIANLPVGIYEVSAEGCRSPLNAWIRLAASSACGPTQPIRSTIPCRSAVKRD